MILPKKIRKFIGIFRGEVAPILILLSAMLGFWFGLMPGWSGLHVALLVIALVLNIHIGIFMMSAGFGKALLFAAAPAFFHAGQWAQGTLAGLFNFLASIPVVGITDFSRYAIAGTVVLGPIIGLILGLLLSQSVLAFRRTWLSIEQNSEGFRNWQAKGWVRFLNRILIGKNTDDVQAVLTRKPKMIRTAGIGVAVVFVVISGVGISFAQGDRAKAYATQSLTQANGAEVNIAELELGMLSGSVSASGVQVTDPDNPANNQIAIGKLSAKADLWNLLLGRVVMDEVKLSDVRFDDPRESPGQVLAGRAESKPAAFDAQPFAKLDTDIAALETYVDNAKALNEWLEKVRQYLPEGKEKLTPAPTETPQEYLEYLSARASTPPTPRVLVKRIVLDKVKLDIEELGESKIVCTNLSDAPEGAGLPMSIEVTSNALGNSISIVSHYESPGGGAQIKATFADLDLQKIQSKLSGKTPVTFSGGTASGAIEGMATRETIDLAINVKTSGMQANAAGKGLFGLDPQVTSEAMKVLENVETTMRLVGPTAQPRLVFDGPALSTGFRDALVSAGKNELAKRADALLGDKVPGVNAKKILDSPTEAVSSGVGNLLAGKAEGAKDEDSQPKDKKDTLSTLKDRLSKPK